MPLPHPTAGVGGGNHSAPGADLVAGDVHPRLVLVGAHVAGQAQHPLAEDVAHHFGRATLDGVGPAAQELVLRVGTGHGPAPDHLVLVVEQGVGAHDVHAERVDGLVELGEGQLARGALGAGGVTAFSATEKR